MDHTPECDEQSEVLFVFTEDAADNQPPPSTSPPATSPPAAESAAPPPIIQLTNPFWSEVYTLNPPHALMGVLTDLHIHRFLLHQHLTTHTALTETPIGHQPLTDTLPQPVQRIIAIYHSNLQRAQHHTRLALNAIDTLARFPPAAYFTDPNFFTSDQQHINPQAASPPSNITPLRRYPLPTPPAAIRPFRMLPPRQPHHGSPFWTPTSQPQASINHNRRPHAQILRAATPRLTSMPLSTTPRSRVSQPHPTRSNQPLQTPRPTFPAPRPPPLLPQQTSNPMNAGSTSTLSPPLQSPLQHNPNTLRIFLPLLAAPRATGAPRPHHVRPPPPAPGNQTPVQDPQFLHPQHHVQLHNNSFPQRNLSRNIHRPRFTQPTRLPLPTTPCNPSLQQRDGPSSKVQLPTKRPFQHLHTLRRHHHTHGRPTGTTTTAAPNNTASRIHDTTPEHRSVCHPVDCTPIGLL